METNAQAIPSSAYAIPSQDDKEANPDFWQGYRLAQTVPPPSPAGAKSYADYRKTVDVMLKPASTFGWPIAYNVGWNSALVDGANWLWIHDPESPHNKV